MTFPRSHPSSPCIISVPVQLAPVNYCGQTLPRRSLRNEGTNDSSGERCGWTLLVILFVLRALLCRNWCITRGTISFEDGGTISDFFMQYLLSYTLRKNPLHVINIIESVKTLSELWMLFPLIPLFSSSLMSQDKFC